MKLLERLDDLMNPIVVKELRQAVQSRFVSGALLLFLALQLLVLGTFVLNRESRQGGNEQFTAGREAFAVQQAILFGACMLLIPLYGGVRMGLERNDANADLLFISALKPRSIVAGKLIALIALTLLVFSTCAPFMTFTYLLRGLDIPTILLVLGIDFGLVVLAIQFALLLAVLPVSRWFHALIALGGLGLNVWVLTTASAGLWFTLQRGTGLSWGWEFWAPMLTAIGGGLGFLGLLFVASVALISPPASNRAFTPRVYLFCLWLATGILACSWAYKYSEPSAMMPWSGFMTITFCAYLVVAINERDNWGPRVARRMPRRSLFRAGAFLLYIGSAGGIAFAVLVLATTFIVFATVETWFYNSRSFVDTRRFLEASLVMSLYVFNYCVAAVLCRAYLLRRWIKPIQTWVVGLGLFVLGISVPPLLAFIFDRGPFNRYGQTPWWFLPNPFWAFSNFFEITGHAEHRLEELSFSVIWAMLLVAAGVPWFFGQFRRFQPLPCKEVAHG